MIRKSGEYVEREVKRVWSVVRRVEEGTVVVVPKSKCCRRN